MKKFRIPILFLILVIAAVPLACGLFTSPDEPPAEAYPDEPPQESKDEPKEEPQVIEAGEIKVFEEKHQDPEDDGIDCPTGKPADTSIDKSADIREVGAGYDPETDMYTLESRVAALETTTVRKNGGDRPLTINSAGGHIFWIEGTPRDESSDWLFDRLGNNSFNYLIYDDNTIEYFRYHFEDPDVGWEEVLNTNFTGTVENGIISMAIPREEILPAGMDPATAIVYWVVSAFDGVLCDAWGLDENNEPEHTLIIDVVPSF